MHQEIGAVLTDTAYPFVIFTLNAHSFAFPAVQVREILPRQDIVPVPQTHYSFIEGVIHVRGRILPLMDLRKRFGLPARDEPSNRIVLVRLPKALIGFVVDSVQEVTMIPIQAIQQTFDGITRDVDKKVLHGVARVGNSLVLLPDLGVLLAPEEHALLAGKKPW